MVTDVSSQLRDFVDLAETRRVSRAYRTDEYEDEVLRGVLRAANRAPSPANVQPWHFVVVDDADKQKELSRIYSDETKEYKRFLDPTFWGAGNSREFVDAPATVLVAGDMRYEQCWPDLPDAYRHNLFHKSMATATLSLHLAAANAGLASTWVTTRGPSQDRLRDLLDLPEYFHVGTAAPLGYPELDRTKDVKARFPLDEKLHEGSYDRSRLPTYEDIMDRKEAAREDVYHPEGDAPPLEEVWDDTAYTLAEFADFVGSWRTTTAYEDTAVDDTVVEDVLEAGIQAPSAGNAQPWELLLVRDAGKRSAVADAVRADRSYVETVDPSHDVGSVQDLVSVPPSVYEEAPLTLVVAGNRHLENLWPNVPDGSPEKLFQHSVTNCATSVTYAANAAGLGTSWYAPAAAGQRALAEQFDLPPWFEVGAVTPLGRPADDGGERPIRASLDDRLHYNALDAERVPNSRTLYEEIP